MESGKFINQEEICLVPAAVEENSRNAVVEKEYLIKLDLIAKVCTKRMEELLGALFQQTSLASKVGTLFTYN